VQALGIIIARAASVILANIPLALIGSLVAM
jgi:hypothetical protein